MMVTKCDLCKKEIKGESIKAGFNFWVDYVELCKECGAPIAKFLKEKKLIKEKK